MYRTLRTDWAFIYLPWKCGISNEKLIYKKFVNDLSICLFIHIGDIDLATRNKLLTKRY